MSDLSRRGFFSRSAVYMSGSLIAPSLLGLIACNDDLSSPDNGRCSVDDGTCGYGPLVQLSNLPFLIPAGFHMAQISKSGDRLTSGSADIPNAFDGMAAFSMTGAGKSNRIRLIRNHEMRDNAATSVPIGNKPYDPKSGGGCTSIEVEVDRDGRPHVVNEFVSLSGTQVNCAGGPTPWGSWLTCEETVEGTNNGFAKEHGYIFEIPVSAETEVDAIPYKQMGRFAHEAVAVDPKTGYVYETEDAGNSSGFYRYIPNSRDNLGAGGRLQMLAVTGRPQLDTTSGGIAPLTSLAAEWVNIDDPDPAVINSTTSCFAQGFTRGGTRFARLEGCWYGDNSIFFNATSGGAAGAGQVWQYRPLSTDAGELVLIFESPSKEVLDSPDNICVSPRGGLVICEDGGGVQFIRGLTQQGSIFDFVRTSTADASEFAGACFSPDGKILFFNTQGSTSRTGTRRGGTYAIWGPWNYGSL